MQVAANFFPIRELHTREHATAQQFPICFSSRRRLINPTVPIVTAILPQERLASEVLKVRVLLPVLSVAGGCIRDQNHQMLVALREVSVKVPSGLWRNYHRTRLLLSQKPPPRFPLNPRVRQMILHMRRSAGAVAITIEFISFVIGKKMLDCDASEAV